MPWVFGLVLKWHDNSELSPLGHASVKFPDQKELQSWIVTFRAEIYAEAKHLALAFKWIKKIEATSSLKDLINPKSITGKDFSDDEELDLMMAADLKWCYDKYPYF